MGPEAGPRGAAHREDEGPRGADRPSAVNGAAGEEEDGEAKPTEEEEEEAGREGRREADRVVPGGRPGAEPVPLLIERG